MAESRRDNTIPQDRGWSWAIAVAGFIAHAVFTSSNQTNSVLFVEILKKYETSITTGSMMFMCHTLTFSIGSVIISTFILPKLEERGCLLIGGLLSCAVSISASFAQNTGLFIAVLSIKGVAHSFIFVPSITLIQFYFKKYRSRAAIIPWCGGCTATIIAPFIIRAARKEFGVSGTYFLLSAVELNVCFAGLLLRPVSAYKRLPDNVDNSLKDNTAPNNTCAANEEADNDVQEDVHPKITIKLQVQDNLEKHADDVKESLLTSEDNTDANNETAEGNITPKILDPTDVAKNKGLLVHRERRNTFLGSVMTLDSEIGTALEVMIQDMTDSHADKGMTMWQKVYRDSSLELWSFRWILLAVLPGTVNIYLNSYLPTITNSLGASLDESALLVTIMGSVDLISRISVGFIIDKNVISPSKLLAITQISIGIVSHLLRLASSYTTLMPMIIFFGMFIGSRAPIISLLCLETVGSKKMPQAYSILSMMGTLIGASFNPVLGAVAKATGSFVFVMHIIGTGYILCGILVSLTPLFSRLDIKHGRKSVTQK